MKIFSIEGLLLVERTIMVHRSDEELQAGIFAAKKRINEVAQGKKLHILISFTGTVASCPGIISCL